MLERVVSRRGKFSPGITQTRDKQRIVPLPVTGNNKAISQGRQELEDDFSRACSPTTHLHQIYVPTPQIRKRKSFSRKLLESFRESPKYKEQIVNKYVKNKLTDGDESYTGPERLFNSINVDRVASRVIRKHSKLRSFIANSFRHLDRNSKDSVTNKQISSGYSFCKFHRWGCSARFCQSRPQLRLQHEATCSSMVVRCQWGGEGEHCDLQLPLHQLHEHLLRVHGHQVTQVEQEGKNPVRLSQALVNQHGETIDCWPDNSGCCTPNVIMISALDQTFLLFMKNSDKMRDDYDISVALLGSPKLATNFGYELRVLDEAGFAYRGPMLSVAVERSQFWTQGYHLHIPNLEVLGSFFQTSVKIFYRE